MRSNEEIRKSVRPGNWQRQAQTAEYAERNMLKDKKHRVQMLCSRLNGGRAEIELTNAVTREGKSEKLKRTACWPREGSVGGWVFMKTGSHHQAGHFTIASSSHRTTSISRAHQANRPPWARRRHAPGGSTPTEPLRRSASQSALGAWSKAGSLSCIGFILW